MASSIILANTITASAASGATDAGDSITLKGGAGGATSGTGGAALVTGGAGVNGNAVGGAATVTAGAGQGTGAGGVGSVVGGSSGAGSTGNGGAAKLTGGAAGSSNGNGGDVVITGGALAGTGVAGVIHARSVLSQVQAVPTAKTVTAAISAAELLTGIITTTGATAPSEHQLPTGTLLETALGGATAFATGDSIDFFLINTGTGASDDATITVNTNVTIVGNPTVGALTDGTIVSGSGHFRARKSAANTFVVYRLA